ncbi:MAG: EVE domain-containing protein [Archaeoglobaceae archaeon]
MTCWFCVTNPENWMVINKEKVWGVSNLYRRVLNKAKKGDKMVICTIEGDEKRKKVDPKIYGIFEVESDPCKDCKIIFHSFRQELCPHRVKIKPIKTPEEPVPIKRFAQNLSFTEKRANQDVPFTRVMMEIPESDFKTIDSSIM